jgi:predicted ATPase/class 3 adenylate cyclase
MRDVRRALRHHAPVRRELPSGTVTFLFTDMEASTKLLHELGAARYAEALSEHRRVVREAVSGHGGIEVDTQGDAFFCVFKSAQDAVGAAAEAQEVLGASRIRIRMGLHTGSPVLTDEGYVGLEVHRGARIAAAAHGGQVVLSEETRTFLGDAFPLTDLGEHRVKDFDQPMCIFQLGSERFPPLKTISNTNLPKPASSFVGREREVQEVASLLRDGARLLTLTGPGGSGKTRLAIAAAFELVPEFKAGVFWVDLAPLRDPILLTDTIARTLGAQRDLVEHIGERELLLLLDNFEQIALAAPGLPAVLEACLNLRLLVTSRAVLRVRGEVAYPVQPLAQPEAVELFCARSRLQADEVVAELCRRLDNLPLALELAAARTSVLSPAGILQRLPQRLDLLRGGRDAVARQQTLRATIEWSHDLLGSEEKRLFARLSVFRGSCTLEAAVQVTDADLDTLQSLVEASLLNHRQDRFWMLETIQEFAAERLNESGEREVFRRRHAEHFLALAEEAQPSLYESHPEEWAERLAREHDNLRAALDRLEASGETELALQLAGAMGRFWHVRDHVAEGRRRLENVLRTEGLPTAVRARALNAAAGLAMNGGDLTTARLWAEEALTQHRWLGDAWGIAYSLYTLGFVACEEGDFSGAQPLLEESLRAFREVGNEHHILTTTRGLAWTHKELGNLERARAMLEDVLRRARAQSNGFVVALCLAELASFARDEGRIQDALSMLAESLRTFRDGSDRGGIAFALCRVARTLAVDGRAETAARLLSSSETMREEMGYSVDMSIYATMRKETLATLGTQLDEGSFAEAWEQGRKLSVDEAVALALVSCAIGGDS